VQISFHTKTPTEASIIIKIEKADYQVRVASKVEEYRKKATIKGFRPGCAPATLVQQMYGRAILIEEVNTLFAESLMKYLKDNEIHALGEPRPVSEKIKTIDWEHWHDFEREYIVGMPGPFSCEFSKSIKITAYKVDCVAAKTLDNLIEQFRKASGEAETISKSAASDVISGELRYPAQNFKIQTKVIVGAVTERERNVFVNLSPKDTITFEVEKIFEQTMKLPGVPREMYETIKLAGVPRAMYETMLELGGLAEFTVEKIHRYTPVALEQAFFDGVLGPGVATSEQEFREKFRKKLLREKQEEANLLFVQSMQEILLQEVAIALPDDFLRNWLQKEDNTVPKEQIATHYPQYAKELRWHILMAALGQKHNLQVTHEEVVGRVWDQLRAVADDSKVVQQSLGKNAVQLIEEFLQKDNGENYRKVYEQVYMYKCINLIRDQITFFVQEISVEEFDELAWK
jgi:trigger factor